MTGYELGQRRAELELTQRQFAELCGVSVVTVVHWEQRRAAPIPAHGAVRARAAFEKAATVERPSESARSELIAAISADPGLPTWRLRQRVGEGKVVLRALRSLEKSGDVKKADAYDSFGRRYQGWYVRGLVPRAVRPMTGAELRRIRSAAGWSQPALAEKLGVGSNTVSRWENGWRQCPPNRAAEIRHVIVESAPLSPHDARVLRELETAAEDRGGATRSELGWPSRKRLIELAIELGRLRAEGHDIETRDGRLFTRTLLFARDAPSPERHERPQMSAEDVRAIRSRVGLSQAALGRLLGVRNMTVSGWETGRVRVPPRHIHQLRKMTNEVDGGASDVTVAGTERASPGAALASELQAKLTAKVTA